MASPPTILALYLNHKSFPLLAHVRLDVPTFEDPLVEEQLHSTASYRSIAAWSALTSIFQYVSMFMRIASQFTVLASVLRGQHDGLMFALLSSAGPMWALFRRPRWRSQGSVGLDF
jgi:hypothetical protein